TVAPGAPQVAACFKLQGVVCFIFWPFVLSAMPHQPSASDPATNTRTDLMSALGHTGQVDMGIVGGGATGVGLALDATLRGRDVVLLEAEDFASGTSSRATKLIHGGVRYLAQGNIALVREALHERTTILRNAPHLAGRLGFIMPGFKCWQMPFYGAGLKA